MATHAQKEGGVGGRISDADARYRSLVERIPAVLYVDSSNGTGPALYVVDPQREFLLGYARQEWLEDPELWVKALHPDDRDRVLARLMLARESGGTFTAEYRLLTRDGSVVWVRDEAAPADDGVPGERAGVLLDITDRKLYEERLKESEERFRLTLEAAGVGMAHVAPDGRWLEINGRLSEIVGYAREELLALTLQDITHPEDLEKDLEHVSRMLLGEIEGYSIEKRYVRKDGRRVWIGLTVSALRSASGGVSCFVSVIEDITARKLAELVPDPLTGRELEVLRRIAFGHKNKQIAEGLRHGVGTIKQDVRNVIAKLGVGDRRRAAARAVEIGLVPPY